MSALRELREQVAAGIGTPSIPFTKALGVEHGLLALQADRGSLDAAKALHEAMLPEWGWRLRDNRAWVWRGVHCSGGEEIEDENFVGQPARAWLLAILDALIQKEDADADNQ